MGIQFKPSAPPPEDIAGPNAGPTEGEKSDKNQNANPASDSKQSTEKEFQTIELNAVPFEQSTAAHDVSFAEFFPQLIGILPGLIILLAAGMQLSWGVIEYDMALWKHMNNVPTYRLDVGIVCCFYIGAIIGNFVGAGMVIHLRPKFSYLIAAFILVLSGECLKNCQYIIYNICGRILLGCTFSITHLTVIAYASETTTQTVRSGLLSFVAYINAFSILLASILASVLPNFDEYQIEAAHPIQPNYVQHTDESELEADLLNAQAIVTFSGIIIMILAIVAMIFAPFATRQSIPFLVRNGQCDKAYTEYVELRSSANDKPGSLRHDFEHWKEHILLQRSQSMTIFRKENMHALRLIISTRLLSLFFNSIVMSAVFIRLLDTDDYTVLTNQTYEHYDQEFAIEFLVGSKTFHIMVGLGLVLISLKWKTDRFCYRLSFMCGLCVCILYVVYSCMDYLINFPLQLILLFVFIVNAIYLTVPFKMEVMHFQHISEAYSEHNNNYKIWSLVFVGCCENLIQILLLLNIFLFISYGILLTGFGILYISFWLLKNTSNAGTIHPMESVFVKARNWNYLRSSHSVHM